MDVGFSFPKVGKPTAKDNKNNDLRFSVYICTLVIGPPRAYRILFIVLQAVKSFEIAHRLISCMISLFLTLIYLCLHKIPIFYVIIFQNALLKDLKNGLIFIRITAIEEMKMNEQVFLFLKVFLIFLNPFTRMTNRFSISKRKMKNRYLSVFFFDFDLENRVFS